MIQLAYNKSARWLCVIVYNLCNWSWISPDQNLVPKPADQMEAQVHQRPGDAGPAVLLFAGHPGPSTPLHRRPVMVCTTNNPSTQPNPLPVTIKSPLSSDWCDWCVGPYLRWHELLIADWSPAWLLIELNIIGLAMAEQSKIRYLSGKSLLMQK